MSMKKHRVFAVLLSCLVGLGASFSAQAVEELNGTGSSYTYTYWKHIQAAPVSYIEDGEIRLAEHTEASSPEDLTVAADGRIFVADKRGSCVYILSDELEIIGRLTTYVQDGETCTLQAPEGVYAGKDYLYVANTGGKNIVLYTYDGQCAGVIAEPSAAELSSTVGYEPTRVCADNGGRVYVISRNQTQGILQFSRAGQFMGYLGASRVNPSVAELLFRSIATEAMLERMQQFIPTEYNNLTADGDGFIYATIGAVENAEIYAAVQARTQAADIPVRRLNPQGNDILNNHGFFPPVGELDFPLYGEGAGASRFADVAVSDGGLYSLLDAARCKVFTYDQEGNLLYIFGGDDGSDPLKQPVSIAYAGDCLIVCDKESTAIRRYAPTEYASRIRQALRLHEQGRYEEEKAAWMAVDSLDAGCSLAALGLGKAALESGDAAAALSYFRQADNKTYYSKALQTRNREFCEKHLMWLLPAGLAAVVGLIFLLRFLAGRIRASRSRMVQQISYAGHVMRHPFDGFWDIKYENRGSVGSATVLLAAAFVVYVLNLCLTPYTFSGENLSEVNVYVNGLAAIVVMVAGWVISSWCFTTLFNGKGRMKDIYIYTCYSLYPYVICTPVLLVVSQFLTVDAASLYQTLSTAVLVWVGFLLFAGTLTVHQYSLGRTVAMILLSLIGMIIMAFLVLLCTNLAADIYHFLATVCQEIAARLFG